MDFPESIISLTMAQMRGELNEMDKHPTVQKLSLISLLIVFISLAKLGFSKGLILVLALLILNNAISLRLHRKPRAFWMLSSLLWIKLGLSFFWITLTISLLQDQARAARLALPLLLCWFSTALIFARFARPFLERKIALYHLHH